MLTKATATNLEEKYFIPGVYFCGDLETEVGYDLVCSSEKEMLETIMNIKETYAVPVTVLIEDSEENYIKSCMLFAWKGLKLGFTKGLVVDINDMEATKFAIEKMNERPDSI